jgi:hypothetical protein
MRKEGMTRHSNMKLFLASHMHMYEILYRQLLSFMPILHSTTQQIVVRARLSKHLLEVTVIKRQRNERLKRKLVRKSTNQLCV